MNKPETKTETPKIETPTPRTENAKMDMITSYWNELARIENAAYERARAMLADASTIAAESMTYAAQLSAEWRKLGLEATRRMVDTFKVA